MIDAGSGPGAPAPRSLRVVMLALEMTPLAKVGGLGDMVASLSAALSARGHDVTVILPAYPDLLADPDRRELPMSTLEFPYAGGLRRQRFHRLARPGLGARVLLLEDPLFSGRDGIYADPVTRADYPDNGDRYALFARGALEILLRVDLRPDVLHLHDFQTALAASLVRRAKVGERLLGPSALVLTVHNIGHQGIYDPSVLDRLGLDGDGRLPGGPLEFWGQVNYLKAGIEDADAVTTVSPRYAEEIQDGYEYGRGLEGVLAARGGGVIGILNGIDTATWDPAADPFLARRYDARSLEGKAANKRILLERTALPPAGDRPVVGMITRLVEQKGIDLVMAAGDRLLDLDVDLVVLGSGQPEYEAFFREWAARRPDRVFHSARFDDPLAHLIEAGADIFLMPSRYEPCGLNQMMSLRYGTVPVVRRVGGLADTVVPADEEPERGTGFVFDEYSAEAMLEALDRALAARRDPVRWEGIVRRGMGQDFSWDRSARRYEELYRSLAPGFGPGSR